MIQTFSKKVRNHSLTPCYVIISVTNGVNINQTTQLKITRAPHVEALYAQRISHQKGSSIIHGQVRHQLWYP